MSNVVLHIGGRRFTVSCADGEEDHVVKLGRLISEKVETLGDTAGQNEVRMLLYAALVLADELVDAQNLAPQQTNDNSQPDREEAPYGVSGQLEQIASRMENLASRLEREPDNP